MRRNSFSRQAPLLAAIAVLLATNTEVSAQETMIVVPNAFADVEGNSTVGVVRNYRIQTIYDASDFASLANSNLLTSLSFRPDHEIPAGHSISHDRVEIRLSTTHVSPDAMSNKFSDNITGEETIVHDGPWSVTTQSVGPATGPKAFDMRIDFDKNFFEYDPSLGNLLLDLRSTGGGVLGADFLASPSSRSRFVWTGNDAIDSEVGTGIFYGGAPTQLTFVPEPSTILLFSFGLLGRIPRLARRHRFRSCSV